MTKSEFRKVYLARQKSFSAEEREMKSFRIAELFFQNFDLSKINFLHLFLPIEKFNEIDTRPIFEILWRKFPNIKTLVPRVNFQTNEIENLKFSIETETAKNLWEIFEPTHDEIIAAEKIDAVLVPLLCFDGQGFRVGYGKGFYDKFLKNCRTNCLKIGLNYFAPIEKISDVDDFDVALDFCVTPDRVWKFSTR
ncbi:MAG: 5-formyltetrahydrofolate cyclo-ligase [Pyrinomonadaceae bacterium]